MCWPAGKRTRHRPETGPLAESSKALLQQIKAAAREQAEGQAAPGKGRSKRKAAGTVAGDVGFDGLVSGGSRLAAARAFGDLLHLGSRGLVAVSQAGAYQELRVGVVGVQG